MKLHIDTTQENINVVQIEERSNTNRSFLDTPDTSLVKEIHSFLQENDLAVNKISEVAVTPGPGTRFTRTRLGIVVANALAFSLHTSVNGKNFETPIYNAEPNITKPNED